MASKALDLTPDERVAYPYLFSKADTDQLGVLVGDKAVAFFTHAKLPPTVLGEIWQLADDENAGFLTRRQFDVALRLIGKAQRGTKPTKDAIASPGPLARLEGFQVPGVANPQSPLPTGAQAAATPASTAPEPSIRGLTADEQAKYARLFNNAGPVDGLLDGDKARDIFIKSRLPFDKLGQIWTLADTQQRGSLSVGDFSIAMHMIQLSMSGQLPRIPASLPPSLVQSVASHRTGQPQSPIGGQFPARAPPSLAVPPRANSSSLGVTAFGQPASPSAAATEPWAISAAELSQSNSFFDQLDQAKQGFVPGDQAVPFLMESKLPGDVLAHVWDLSDIRGQGALNREEFAVAMRLIQDKLGGKDLPASLPTALIPPSLRGVAPPTQPHTETQKDLLSLMDDDPEPTKPPAQPEATPTRNLPTAIAPQLTGASVRSAGRSAAASPLPASNLRSQLGSPRSGTASIVSHPTGAGSADGPIRRSDSPASLDDSGAKLGNLRNQLSSTERGLAGLQSERSQLETQGASTAAQISELETKLATAKNSYQNETRLLADLRSRQAEQSAAMARLKEEVIRAESDLSGLRLERSELEGSILRDKEDVRNMKTQMQALNEETAQLKASLEALKKEARQQKGLVAIGKKQLTTSESQKDQAAKELEEAKETGSGLPSEPPSAPSVPSSETPRVTSPALSATSARSTNPFERMLAGNDPTDGQSSAPTSSRDTTHLDDSLVTDAFHHAEADPTPQAAVGGGFDEAFGFDDAFAASDAKPDHPPPPSESAAFATPADLPSSQASEAVVAPAEELPVASPVHKPVVEEEESSDEDEVEEAFARPLGQEPTPPESSEAAAKFPPIDEALPREPAVKQAEPQAPSSMPGGFPDGFANVSTPEPAAEKNASTSVRRAPPLPPSRTSGGQASAVPKNLEAPIEGFPGGTSSLDTTGGAAIGGSAVNDHSRATSAESHDDFKDFESSFASLPQQNEPTSTAPKDDFAGFDESFDDAFGIPASNKPAAASHPFNDDFESSFAGFENKPQGPNGAASHPTEDFSFDDTFGTNGFAAAAPLAGPPPALPARSTSTGAKPTPPKDTDSAAVHQICAMGFSREEAIRALERDDFDVERATNHLLGS